MERSETKRGQDRQCQNQSGVYPIIWWLIGPKAADHDGAVTISKYVGKIVEDVRERVVSIEKPGL